jgi:hypothetical protein
MTSEWSVSVRLSCIVGACFLGLTVASCSSSSKGSSPDGGQDGRTAIACTSVNDCTDTALGTAWCCLVKACVYSSNGTPPITCTDADVQLIQASNYDQSCTMDSDCVAVSEGNFCYGANCPSAAINVGAQAHYNADVAMTNAAICGGATSCPGLTGPCCRGGTCQTGDHCSPSGSSDTGTSDAPAGG